MKKLFISIIVIMLVLLSCETVFAIDTKNTTNEFIETQEKAETDINNYVKKYGSQSYGMTAYVLDVVRGYSIPVCFIGIVVGALYQYVLGTRRLDMKQKGFGLIILFVTILVICQVLPLIFAIVVKGWRG